MAHDHRMRPLPEPHMNEVEKLRKGIIRSRRGGGKFYQAEKDEDVALSDEDLRSMHETSEDAETRENDKY